MTQLIVSLRYLPNSTDVEISNTPSTAFVGKVSSKQESKKLLLAIAAVHVQYSVASCSHKSSKCNK